jgi:hypothetical protein
MGKDSRVRAIGVIICRLRIVLLVVSEPAGHAVNCLWISAHGSDGCRSRHRPLRGETAKLGAVVRSKQRQRVYLV